MRVHLGEKGHVYQEVEVRGRKVLRAGGELPAQPKRVLCGAPVPSGALPTVASHFDPKTCPSCLRTLSQRRGSLVQPLMWE